MKYLAERYDLTKVSMVGASGGSLASVLAACGVPADRVMQRAYEMSIEHNIWERPLGLLGIWGSLIEKVRVLRHTCIIALTHIRPSALSLRRAAPIDNP